MIRTKLGAMVTAGIVGAAAYGAGLLVSRPSVEEVLIGQVEETIEQLVQLHAEIDNGEAQVIWKYVDERRSCNHNFRVYQQENSDYLIRTQLLHPKGGQRYDLQLSSGDSVDFYISTSFTAPLVKTLGGTFPKCHLGSKSFCMIKLSPIENFLDRFGEYAHYAKETPISPQLKESFIELGSTVDGIIDHSMKVFERTHSCNDYTRK